MVRSRVAVGMVAVLALGGCAAMRKDKYCKWGFPVWGAVAGGVGAGLGVGEGVDDPSSGEIAGAAVGGTLVGAGLGWLVGHYVCEPEEAPPPPVPPPPPPPVAGRKIETLTGPSFEFDKARLTSEGRAHVDHAVQIMQESPSMRVVVEGNTDSIGSDAYNMKLSQRRADTVRDYMVQKGISASRIRTAAYGETRPIASNKTAEGRAQNRRVDIVTE